MNTSNKNTSADSFDVSDSTLAEIPRRAFAFINTLGSQVSIRAVLNAHGYTEADHEEGWRLLVKASSSPRAVLAYSSAPAAAAVEELDETDELLFHKAHAAIVTENLEHPPDAGHRGGGRAHCRSQGALRLVLAVVRAHARSRHAA